MSAYKPEELMHIYYSEYWESWEDNLAYVDPKNPLSYFVNFEGVPILYPLTQASYMAKHYPFEMYSLEAVSKDFEDDYKAFDASSFDSTYYDPYTGEDLELPLSTLRWNYYIENFMEENLNKFYKSSKFTYAFGLSSKLLDDLEENNDLISSILETIHEPTFRNTIEYGSFLQFAKIRLDLSFMLFVEYNTARSVSLLTIPWIFLFGIGDLLTNEFSNLTIIFCDLKSIFLYLFFGQELVWQFEETFKEYVSNIFSGVKYSVYNRKYKKHYTTFKNDISKIWRLINLKTAEPKLYKKLKQYMLLSIKKKIYFSIAILRATAVRDKQYFRISLFNTATLLRFFIWCYKKLIIVIPNYYKNFKIFLKNLISNIFMFIKNFIINLIPNILKYIKKLPSRLKSFWDFFYNYVKSKI